MADSLTIYPTLPLVEKILLPWQERIGVDFDGYRNHVYRMLHCCFALAPCSEQDRSKLMIAACHHDIGIWSDHTVDYLPPSIREAATYLEANQLSSWVEEVTLLIDLHHKFRSLTGDVAERYPLVEVFRRADLADFSLGLILGGVPRKYFGSVKRQFPNAGFHKMLIRAAVGWFAKHPLSPPPFMKW